MGACQATLWFSIFIVAHQRLLFFFAFSCSLHFLADSPVGFGPLCEWVNAAVRSHLTSAQMNLIVLLSEEAWTQPLKNAEGKRMCTVVEIRNGANQVCRSQSRLTFTGC